MGLWDQLPFDLLNKIDEHLELYQDKVRSKCVCAHWERSFPELPDLRQQQPPWLLLPFTSGSLCGLFHPLEKKLFVIDLPEVGEYVFKGSDHGWVVSIKQNGSIDVVNPLTRVRFPLPPRHEFFDVLKYCPEKVGDEYLLKTLIIGRAPGFGLYSPEPPYTSDSEFVRDRLILKIALSCAPTHGVDFRAVAIYGESCRLAYCKLGDEKWTDMVKPKSHNSYVDIAFSGGKLYALNNNFELMVCDDIVSCPNLRKLIPKGFAGEASNNLHLINSLDGGIMMVCRRRKKKQCGNRSTFDFEIYKLDLVNLGWIRMASLASDEILFMGLGTQLAIRGRSGNRIYFTHHQWNFKGQEKDDGIFMFENKKIKPLGFEDEKVESLGYEFNPKMIFPSMIWVMPNPY